MRQDMSTKGSNFLASLTRLGIGIMLLAGLFTTARAAAPGDLDPTFGNNGLIATDIGAGTGDKAYSIGIQSDGKIVVAGSSDNGIDDDFALVRYNDDGSLDATFDADGKLSTPLGSGNDRAYSLAIQPDGKIVVAGSSDNGADNDFALVRYDSDGGLDTTFDTDGIVTTDIGGDVAKSVAIQSDGKIVVAGSADGDFAVLRYNSDGSLDTSFDGDGIVTTDFGGGGNDEAHAIAIQPDGKIVVAGHSDLGGASDEFAVARYSTDGSLDATFDFDGLVTTDFNSNSVDQAFSLAIQPDGKIVVAGLSNSGSDDFAVARYHSGGSLDTAFDADGKVITPIGTADDQAYSVVLQPTGKIVVAGFSDNGPTTHQDYSVVRYKSDGSLDATFGAGGIVSTDLGTINTVNASADYAFAAATQADDKIVVAGYSDFPTGDDNFAVVRYQSPNAVPTISDVPKTGYEDSDVAFSTTDFTSHFDDAYGDDLVQIQVTSLPADGTLELNGSPVTPDQEILAADLDNLSFTPNAEWNGFSSFGWNGFDGIVYAASGAAVNITIEPVNDRPSFTVGADQVANEDAGAQAAPGWATDIWAGPDNEAGQVLTFTVETDAGAFFAVQPAIDSTSGDLTYTSADDANGSATITVTLVDNGGTGNGGTDTSLPQTFTITINPVNDAPSFTRGDDQVVDEDVGAQIVSAWATDILAGPDDESGQGLVFTVIADNNALFAVPPAISPFTGDLTYTPADNLYGSASVTVTLMDNGGTDNGGMDTSLPQTFTITVDPVNDAPVVSDLDKTGSMNTDTAFATTDFASHFSDVDGDALVQIQVTSLPAHGTLKLNGIPIVENQEIPAADLGALTFAPETDWFGSTSFGWNGFDGITYATSDAAANISVLEPYRVFLPVTMRNASAP